jgi:hypothetical protein
VTWNSAHTNTVYVSVTYNYAPPPCCCDCNGYGDLMQIPGAIVCRACLDKRNRAEAVKKVAEWLPEDVNGRVLNYLAHRYGPPPMSVLPLR